MQHNEQVVKILKLIKEISSDISGKKDEIAGLIELVNEFKKFVSQVIQVVPKASNNIDGLNIPENSDKAEEESLEKNDINAFNEVIEALKELEAELRELEYTDDADLIRCVIVTDVEVKEPLLEETPVESAKVEIDFSLLEDAETMFESWKFEDEVKATFCEFCQMFRDISSNLPEFRKEVEAGMFNPDGTGNAGKFYEHLSKAVEILNGTVIADVPWVLMNQLASILNYNHKAYYAAFRITQALLLIKIAQPSAEILEEMKVNGKQFQKNHHWQELDEMITNKDYIEASLVIEELMKVEDCPEEHESLLKIKAQVIEKSSKIPWLFISTSVFIASLVVAIAVLKAGPKITGRVQTFSAVKTANEERIERFYVGQSALKEELPPLQPNECKLNLSQVRFLVFQKRRIEYLEKQSLSQNEQRLLKRLQEEYNKRCKFYKHNTNDKDQILIELKKFDKAICADASYMLKSWEKVYGVVGVDDIAPAKTEIKLLDIKIADNVEKIQKRLHARGFYKGYINKKWNKETKDALMSFKVMELKVVNSKWDVKTQNALLGKYAK